MKIEEISGSSLSQIYLYMALDDAVAEFEKTHKEIAKQPPLQEGIVKPEIALLHYKYEQWRVTSLILTACCVEAAANLYLGYKTIPHQFAILERAKFLEKWTIVPSFFFPNYEFPKGGTLYQDLKRVHKCRNALVHIKEEIRRDGSVIHNGTFPKAAPNEVALMKRCKTLPERLLSHIAKYDNSEAVGVVRDVFTLRNFKQGISRLAQRRGFEHT